ncbi:hypothetical protein [Herbaspirillum sp. SJZ107]|uniref:hypothetical protein n=1 Tax=Herbaspirillum sp. SJZ107 TaxID=2572881 RepID=UPI0011533A79|nr:hypothetical protein [Herbaspirillum sp. SJZ107]
MSQVFICSDVHIAQPSHATTISPLFFCADPIGAFFPCCSGADDRSALAKGQAGARCIGNDNPQYAAVARTRFKIGRSRDGAWLPESAVVDATVHMLFEELRVVSKYTFRSWVPRPAPV